MTSTEAGDFWEPQDEKGNFGHGDYIRFASGTIAKTENTDNLYCGARIITSGSGVHVWSLKVEWTDGMVIIGAQSGKGDGMAHGCMGMLLNKDGTPFNLSEWTPQDLAEEFGSPEPNFAYKPGDIVDVILDLNKKHISFKTNGLDNGVTYDDLEQIQGTGTGTRYKDGHWQIYSKHAGTVTVEILSYSEQP